MNWLPTYLEAISERLAQTAAGRTNPLYQPARYILDLGGKRMRPVVALLGHELFADQWQNALPQATAVEVFHNFSLVHDDIMDDAPLRRGQQTVHEKWNANQAILSGDAMLVLAYDALLQGRPERLAAQMALFNRTALEVCEGQQLDMDFEQRMDVTVDEYLDMIRLKTSVLLAASLQMGAIEADASAADQSHLYRFGLDIGLAFQLRDDYLDAFGDSATFGKQVGGDILADKKTYLLIRALEQAGDAERETLEAYIGRAGVDAQEKIAAVKGVMEALHIPEELLALSDRYYDAALEHLEAIGVDAPRKARLRELAAWLMQRDR